MKKLMALTVSAVVGCMLAVSAQAGTVEMSYNGFTDNAYKQGSISGPRNATVNAGQFEFNVVDGWENETLEAFCVDVTKNLVTSGTVSYQYSLADVSTYSRVNDNIGQVSALYNMHYGDLGNATNNAAFQLALWSVLYDDFGYAGFDYNVHSQVTYYLETIGSWAGDSMFDFWVLTPDSPTNNQTLLTVTPRAVPEPGTLALLGLGLLMLVVARRRFSR